MAAMARCRICKAEFALARLLDDWSCCCPSCATPLAQDGPVRARILRKAAAVDRLEVQLVDTLGEIVATESNLELSIGPIVARILRDIDWQRQLEHDLSFAQRQVDQIRDALREWTTRLDTRADNLAAEQEGALPEEMHELAHVSAKWGTRSTAPHIHKRRDVRAAWCAPRPARSIRLQGTWQPDEDANRNWPRRWTTPPMPSSLRTRGTGTSRATDDALDGLGCSDSKGDNNVAL